ncbi:MAG: TetR/AcrR family transcriptional regulator [Cyanobacteria bacterium J06626_18]
MPRSGEKTKQRILDAAHELVMGHGLSGTSIDRVLEKANITKGAFFYHFKTKADLAQALVQRYADRDAAHLEAQMGRAEKLSRDPLQQILILIGLFQEEVESLNDPSGGCLIASYIYQFEELGGDIKDISAQLFYIGDNAWETNLLLRSPTLLPVFRSAQHPWPMHWCPPLREHL